MVLGKFQKGIIRCIFSSPGLVLGVLRFWGSSQQVYGRQPPNARFLALPCYVALPSTLSVPQHCLLLIKCDCHYSPFLGIIFLSFQEFSFDSEPFRVGFVRTIAVDCRF